MNKTVHENGHYYRLTLEYEDGMYVLIVDPKHRPAKYQYIFRDKRGASRQIHDQLKRWGIRKVF